MQKSNQENQNYSQAIPIGRKIAETDTIASGAQWAFWTPGRMARPPTGWECAAQRRAARTNEDRRPRLCIPCRIRDN